MDRRSRSKGRMDPSLLLPDDVLADVLRLLPKRSLAVSRCVCKKWRSVIGAHPVLRAELFPRTLAGILINFQGWDITEFFSRRSRDDHAISGKHDYLPDDSMTRSWSLVRDHCNGLLLLDGYVLNPATRWWARLWDPPQPRMGKNSSEAGYLIYDPLVSPHYEVFLVPRFDYRSKREDLFDWDGLNPLVEQSEWPPSQCVLNVFSSKTNQWEERAFLREGAASGTLAHMRTDSPKVQRNAVYWQGSLYVHCQTDFLMRISLSDFKFQVIKPPEDIILSKHPKLCLGKSEKGVYCALIYKQCSLRVWFLDESKYPMEWVLMNDSDLARLHVDGCKQVQESCWYTLMIWRCEQFLHGRDRQVHQQ
ncbi:hypothetical protein QOZ80_3BG0267300 [Eleusine coracana subsp. coracana]|nr:hypothetical protein QOZ80_3BG0267300 [Eleusine coracana subsp. coracana]